MRRLHTVSIMTPVLILVLATVAAAQAGPGWPVYGGDQGNTRYSTLSQVNAGNVQRLKVAWVLQLGSLRSQESTPLVIGDTMYVVTPYPNVLYAFDLAQERIECFSAFRFLYERLLGDERAELLFANAVARTLPRCAVVTSETRLR